MRRNRSLAVIALFLSLAPTAFGVDVHREILLPAQSKVGSGYCSGGTALPCFDCSGFVVSLYRPFVPSLPRVSRDMARFGEPVSRSDLRPGDLVFFQTASRPGVSHVAIYMGGDSIIHAISDGPDRGVTVTPLSARYWNTRYHSAMRVLPQASVEDAPSSTLEPIRYASGEYRGALQDGVPHGAGEMALDNGDRYTGDFVDGQFEGRGVYRWQSGARYEGSFRRGEMDGDGVFVAANGAVREGTWRDGELLTPPAAPSVATQAEPEVEETYDPVAASSWNRWDGVVQGDFDAWYADQQRAFEQFMRDNQPPASR